MLRGIIIKESYSLATVVCRLLHALEDHVYIIFQSQSDHAAQNVMGRVFLTPSDACSERDMKFVIFACFCDQEDLLNVCDRSM